MGFQRNFVSDEETEKILRKVENKSLFIRDAIKKYSIELKGGKK